jgi:hypothetical protein
VNLKDKGWESVDWIDVAEERGMWKAVVNMAMNVQIA